jgi:2-polyprenyl-3-methyl-5-hydroxy-6-metoxy-1,4-benzoquinol methylase
MPTQTPRSAAAQRLRPSPNFALNFTFDGRPYVAKDSEPYIQYWLTQRDRILLAMFSSRRGATIDEAIAAYCRATGTPKRNTERARLLKAIEDMRAGGVLIASRDDTSRYTAKIVAAYVAHRPFPKHLSELIIRNAAIDAHSAVLDLAGGPGDLALALAKTSDHVSMMELSRGFVNAARARAKRLELKLTTIHESCNRLMFHNEQYDVVTVSQALQWLDDVQVCRGICRCLKPGGSFFVIVGGFEVAHDHPLSYILGSKSILGHKAKQSFAAQAQALLQRLTLLFEALDAPDVQRRDLTHQQALVDGGAPARIGPKDARLFRQRRPLDVGFARAFLTPQHVAATGQAPEAFWHDLERRCANATPEQLLGRYDWAVLQFGRDQTSAPVAPLNVAATIEIGF